MQLNLFSQATCIIDWLDMFGMMFDNNDHDLINANPNRILPTGITWEYKKSVSYCVQCLAQVSLGTQKLLDGLA